MVKFNSLIIFFLLLLGNIFSQNKEITHTLFGQVLDDKEEELSYVSVGVFNIKDSSYVKGAATDINGKFLIDIPSGNYYAKISFLSFEEKIIPNITVSDKNVDLKKINMLPSVKNLEEFEVVEEKRLMELDLDKRVFNVSKDITNQGADAAEILDNVPSVSVDIDGNVSLRGSENVRILINGKQSGLVDISVSDALKQLQGNQIEKIEVITNPSSRYDAEGEVGIINIILKRDKREGMNGSVNVDLGYPDNYGGGFNLTIKRKNFNVFSGYGVNYRASPGSRNSNQKFTYPDTSFSYIGKTKMDRFRRNHNLRLGTEVFINEYNSITISGNYNLGNSDNENNVSYSDFNEGKELVLESNRQEIEVKDRTSYDLSLNYRKTFKKKDRLFTFDIKQTKNLDNENSVISQSNIYILEDNIEQRAFNNEGSFNWLFQTDYIHPIKNGKLEMGLKTNLREIVDDYAVEEYDDSLAVWDYIPGFKNELLYNEDVSAAYLMLGKKDKKFSYQLGIRTEYTEMKTDLKVTNEVNNIKYLSFFPSVNLSYELTQENSLQVSYSRRIQRPRHFYLLPFFNFSDARSTFSGNPNLIPEFTDAFELGYLKYWGKASLLSSVYYRYTINSISWITFSDAAGITNRMPVNLGFKNAFGVEFSGSYEIRKWWDLRGSFNFYREIREGTHDGVFYDSDAFAWSTRLNSKWSIINKINLQAAFNYNAPRQSPQGENKARYSLDAGFSFDVLKGDGTLSFNVKDMFNTRRRRSISFGENFVSESDSQWRSRYLRISFTYRINQKKKRGGDRNFQNYDGGGMG